MKEYIIVNKTAIENKIAMLREEFDQKSKVDHEGRTLIAGQIIALVDVLHQSTPLLSEIEKAFDEGKSIGIISYQPQGHTLDKELYNERKQDYISNLKLDI